MKKSVIDNFRGEYSFLSNFYPCELWWEGKQYNSLEQAFQASKTLDDNEREWIRTAPTPGKAKRRGRQITLRKDWEKIKFHVMEELLKRKFDDPKLRKVLLATEDAELIEGNSWGDVVWGVYNGKGQNWLGKLLMKVREELREKDNPNENNDPR